MKEMKITDGEFEVIQVLWRLGTSASRKDIENELLIQHKMASTTLLSFLTRLEEKGYVKIQKIGNSNLYTPMISEHEYLANQSSYFIQKKCHKNISVFVSALCDSGLSKKEMNELRKCLEEYNG